ncbi:MAG: hypothetical protein Q8909_07110 [Bacteroidota bacterium]|nr:hypothetical protein [Bacteroidota bacterium]
MNRTNLILVVTLFLLFSCKHKETDSERYKRNIKATIESLTQKVDSFTRTTGIQKTIFVIDTTDIRFKNLVRLDKATTKKIMKGEMIMEDKFSHEIVSLRTELYFFDNLTSVFKDTTYVILEKENIIMPNLRLYLVRMKKDKTMIKLLAAVESQFCMTTVTTSALLGDSVVFTRQTSHAISDAGLSNDKTYFVGTERIKRFILKDNTYTTLDSTMTRGYE